MMRSPLSGCEPTTLVVSRGRWSLGAVTLAPASVHWIGQSCSCDTLGMVDRMPK